MISIKAEKREDFSNKVKKLRKQGIMPAVLYGPKIDNLFIKINSKEFEELYKKAGESTLISLEVGEKKFSVLIHEIKKDPITGKLIHADLYQPILTEKVEANVPIVFEGEPLAVKELGGTLVKEIQEVVVKALPQNLPHEIKVNVENLQTFEDEILIKDLHIADNVEIQKNANEVVAIVTPPQKVEEELEKPIEEGEIEEETIDKEEDKKESEEKEIKEEESVEKQKEDEK